MLFHVLGRVMVDVAFPVPVFAFGQVWIFPLLLSRLPARVGTGSGTAALLAGFVPRGVIIALRASPGGIAADDLAEHAVGVIEKGQFAALELPEKLFQLTSTRLA